jgi:hypothetical protein
MLNRCSIDERTQVHILCISFERAGTVDVCFSFGFEEPMTIKEGLQTQPTLDASEPGQMQQEYTLNLVASYQIFLIDDNRGHSSN